MFQSQALDFSILIPALVLGDIFTQDRAGLLLTL